MTAETQTTIPFKEHLQPQEVAWIMVVRTEPELGILAAERIIDQSITFPGGKIEANEQPIDAGIRELAEETNLHIKPDEVFAAGSSQIMITSDRTHIHAFPFFAFWGSVIGQTIQTIQPDKHSNWKWFSFSEIADSIINGKLPAKFDLEFFVRLSKLIFDATYEDDLPAATVGILHNDQEYVYWSQLEEFQRNLFGKAFDYTYN